jgi:hypothetical protein
MAFSMNVPEQSLLPLFLEPIFAEGMWWWVDQLGLPADKSDRPPYAYGACFYSISTMIFTGTGFVSMSKTGDFRTSSSTFA